MRIILVLILLFPLAIGISTAQTSAGPNPAQSYEKQRAVEQKNTIEPFRRGAIRSPRRSYNPGIGPGRTAPARPDNAARNPAAPRTTPAPRTGFGGFFGGIFGGLALGTILGSLFNPFAGFSLGFPLLSLLSFALWLIVIVAIFRMFRRKKEY
ncbi:hypothetical protein [Paenibacillus humicola]|uniref:hypothetical protein n=1 Tax=Paenibacillus humicola TaxID=3110540 RepID=UPI00237C0B0B|nr:hypothetical protein [Paenibacillus humicola]